MRVISKLVIFASAGVVFVGPAIAEPRTEAIPLPPGKSDVNKIVCQREEEIGSRLKGKKVCMTVEQWQAFQAQHREDVERMQQHANTRSGG